jgi:hypothetical protein
MINRGGSTESGTFVPFYRAIQNVLLESLNICFGKEVIEDDKN